MTLSYLWCPPDPDDPDDVEGTYDCNAMPPPSMMFHRLLQVVLGVQFLLVPGRTLILVKQSWWGALQGRSLRAQVTL